MNSLTTFDAPALPAADLEIAKDFALASKAAATRRAYQKDFARFTAWCAERGLPPIPAAPETVAAFLAANFDHGVNFAMIMRPTEQCHGCRIEFCKLRCPYWLHAQRAQAVGYSFVAAGERTFVAS
jgi:hypothetical protein